MKSLLLLPSLLFLFPAEAVSWRFVSKVEELPVEVTDRLEVARPKVRLCGGDSEESTDCVLCTVCHPHEYELIGCSGQMDSVCASCTTGWLRSTPKTPDFFRKCKKHPQLPFLFPDIPYPVKPASSMFADQEKRLLNAENTETAEMDDELSEESDDYDGEEEDEHDEGGENAREEETEEDQSKETGVKAVDVDEEDEEDSQELTPLQRIVKKKLLDHSVEESKEQELVIKSIEDDASDEDKEIEIPGDFESKMEKVVEASEEDDNSEESTHRLYPLHKANIWRIIGPEMGRADDKGISKEERQAISDYKKAWWMTRMRLQSDDNKKIDSEDEGTKVIGGYRPVPVRVYYISRSEELTSKYPCLALGWVLLSLIFVSALFVAIRRCALRRRNRFAVLPELDDMSRQLINEAHARVHGKTEKKTRPEFV